MLFVVESLESRRLYTAAQDLTSLTALRADPTYSAINGSGVGVAILDTGTWAQHPDLKSNFVAYFDAVKNLASAAGTTDITKAVDPDGHGTHTAGIAVSSNPNIGVATGAGLIAVRVLPADGETEPSYDTVANGLQWVLNNEAKYNIKVVNMSLGVTGVNDNTGKLTDQESRIIDELEADGVTVVSAAGNDYADFAAPGATTPAAYSTLNVSNVWADTGENSDFPLITGAGGSDVHYFAQENDAEPDRFAATSQRSTIPGSIAAPGSDILSTWNDPNKLYQYESGTSMASPFIAGTVALMQQTAYMFGGHYLTPDQIRTTLISSADQIVDSNVSTNSRVPVTFDSSGNPRRSGANQNLPETGLTFARVNVYAAVRAVRALVTGTSDTGPSNPTVPPPPPPPVSSVDPDSTIATATAVPALDATKTYNFTANVGSDGATFIGAKDVDVYQIQLDSRGVLSAQITGTTNVTVRLFDANGNELAETDGVAPTLVSSQLNTGTYYLGISGAGNAAYAITANTGTAAATSTGDYTLNIGLSNPDPNGVPSGAEDVDLTSPNGDDPRFNLYSTGFAGTIGSDPNPLDASADRINIGATDVDMFKVVMPDNGNFTIDTIGSSALSDGVDTYIRVFDANYNEVANDDDTYGADFGGNPNQSPGRDAFVQLSNVTAGAVYYVAVTTYGNRNFNVLDPFARSSTTGETGSYEVFFSFDNGDVDGTAYNANFATVGANVNAAIGSDPTGTFLGANGGDKDVDFYRYIVPSDGLIDLQVTPNSDGFSPVLTLWRLSSDQTEITRDADTVGRSPHIIASVSAGEAIYVSVTGAGNEDFNWSAVASGSGGSTGAYTLSSAVRPASDLAKLTNSSIEFGTPTPITPGNPIYANLGVTNSVETGAASVNLYKYVATFTGPITVRASVPEDQSTDPFLRLFDANGNELTYNDDVSANTRDALITYNVTAGNVYYIGVNPSSDNARSYDPITGNNASPGVEGDYVLTLSAAPTLTLTAQAASAGASTVTFTLTLSGISDNPVTAVFSTEDTTGPNGATSGVDFTAVSQLITIPAGETTATVTVNVNPDTTPGRVRLIGGSLSSVTNAESGDIDTTAAVPAEVPATPASGPDLAATAFQLKPKGAITPGDKVAATVTVTNVGTDLVSGKFSIAPVLSSDAFFSSDDLNLLVKTKLQNLHLQPNQSKTISLSLVIPATADAGSYAPLVNVSPATGTTDNGAYNNTTAANAVAVQWLFGTFDGHKNKKLTLPSLNGTPITFSLTGNGSGTITREASGLLSVTLSGTTTKSAFAASPVGSATAEIFDFTDASPLKAIKAPNITLLGALTTATPAPTLIQFANR